MTLLRRTVAGLLLGGIVLLSLGMRVGSLALGWTAERSDAAGGDTLASTYSAPGPRAVGLRQISIGHGAPIEGLLWYPSLAEGPGSARYAYGLKALGPSPFPLATYEGIAIRDAVADLDGGPFPLVILSPGFAFGVGAYGWLAEHIASHGFVVLGMEHVEELDPSALWRATVDRPRDTVAALDHAESEVQGGSWRGLVDVSRVAVIGHSYGGYTALAAAGAVLDTGRLREICDAAAPGDPIRFQCDALVPHIGHMADAADLSSPPDGLWPTWGDDRVDAVIALAGDAVMFGEVGMAAVEVPVMTIGGTADLDSPYGWGTRLAYEASSSARKVEIGLEGAAHMVFTGPCERSRRVLTVFPEPFCADPTWDRREAHEVVRHSVTAFLLAELTGDAEAAHALAAPDSVPGTSHAATGY